MASEQRPRLVEGDRRPTALPRQAALDNRVIFRQLILDEIRAGRMTPAQRRRVVRYAAKLDLSAVEAGRLVSECCDEILSGEDDGARAHALRLAHPSPSKTRAALPLLGIVAVAILVNLLLLD